MTLEKAHVNDELVDLAPLTIRGIALRTDNSEAGLVKIQQHWRQFFRQSALQQIGAREGAPICEAYLDYESDAELLAPPPDRRPG
ncbi:hypothetical protein [Burkholderia arboris]|uniref:hypothetical protein n=1 Tax=Burkholderia arboris TaxID=488730 RepID=UPI001CF5A9F0|nr:hypothetical protein [Burkholderia arboris]MCA8491529.1 hypothetical protein [Burkholderia arboris]